MSEPNPTSDAPHTSQDTAVTPPAPVPEPPPAAVAVAAGTKTEREFDLERQLEAERAKRKGVELRAMQLEDENRQLKTLPRDPHHTDKRSFLDGCTFFPN